MPWLEAVWRRFGKFSHEAKTEAQKKTASELGLHYDVAPGSPEFEKVNAEPQFSSIRNLLEEKYFPTPDEGPTHERANSIREVVSGSGRSSLEIGKN